uniref:Uncharacterized protein n=1 Tax=uncultured Armatimonadetes bacterium TaxID=157466 RepID=A0A6J4K098_9BACT|nr:hypothetical protein AVDCRST_MAG63-4469 [uncultured Armatimonadetes bacterium]
MPGNPCIFFVGPPCGLLFLSHGYPSIINGFVRGILYRAPAEAERE